MDELKQQKHKDGSLPGLEIIYLVIVLAISGLVLINLEVNLRWLKNFSQALRTQAVNYEIAEARRAAGIMENSARQEVAGIENLAFSLSLIGRQSAEAEIIIQNFLKKNHHTREVAIAELNGSVSERHSRSIAYEEGSLGDLANLEPFEEAKSGRTFTSRVNYNEFSEPFVFITAPLYDFASGTVSAVLLAHYYLRGMWEIAIEQKIGETGRISVVDDKGMLIADPQPARVLRKTNLLSLPPAKPAIRGEEFPGAKYVNEKGAPVIGVGVPIAFANLKWGVIVEQDVAEIERHLAEVNRWVVVFLAGNLIVIAILLWLGYMIFMANRELKRKHRFAESARFKAEEEKNKTTAMVMNFVDPIILVDNEWRLTMFNPAARAAFKLTDRDLGRKLKTDKGYFSFACLGKIIKADFIVKELSAGNENSPLVEEVVIKTGKKTESGANPFFSGLDDNGAGVLVYKATTIEVCNQQKACYGHMKIFYDMTREKEVDRLKSEFISIAAHQLRTPLSAIKWVIKMVLDEDRGSLTADQKDLLAKGYQSNERIIKVVNDMLNVSRIEEGRFGFVMGESDFAPILAVALDNFENLVKKKNIRLARLLPAGLPRVKADSQKLAIAFESIFDNAAKYTPENGRIEISVWVDNKYLYCRIKDNGVGIPAQDQKKIFTKFFRAQNVVRMQTEGSGLGLFIVKNIIEQHGGSIGFTSREGQGTEFTIKLPVIKKRIRKTA